MPISRISFDDLSETDLNDEIAAGVPEGLLVDYKREMYGGADADVREFLKDVTSFANTAGGHLIIGIDEAAGQPTALAPLTSIDPDHALQRFENLIASAIEPRIFGIQMKAIPIESGGVVIVIRIPQSWRPPHRVSAKGTNKFYGRNSAGTFELSVEDLRMLFTAGGEAANHVRSFRDQRLQKIDAGRTIAPLANDLGRIVLHLVPLSAYRTPNQVDLASASSLSTRLHPLGDGMGYSSRINFEGFANIYSTDKGCGSYTQVFRNGAIEAVKVRTAAQLESGPLSLPSLAIERWLIERLPEYLGVMRDLGLAPPIVVMITLQDIAGARLAVGDDDFYSDVPPIMERDLQLPDVLVESFGTDIEVHRAIRPAFDALWNTAGRLRSRHFDANGLWVGRTQRR